MPEPVRVIFLGGLGEIGRNCMAIEQGSGDRRSIVLIDCGLMFPDADMHGIDLVLPDFGYLARARQPHRRAGGDPRSRGPRGRDPVPPARPRRDRPRPRPAAAGVRRGADARPRPPPHRGSRSARSDRAAPGRRQRDGQDRRLRRRVHPGHALGSARPRHRRPHRPGRDPAFGGLEARPDTGRRPSHRLGQARPADRRSGRAPADGRLDELRGAGLRPQ